MKSTQNDAWHTSKKKLLRKHRKPLRKEQLIPGVVLMDNRGDKRTILRVDYPFYVLSHHNTHSLEGRKWTYNQLVEMENYIISRPL